MLRVLQVLLCALLRSATATSNEPMRRRGRFQGASVAQVTQKVPRGTLPLSLRPLPLPLRPLPLKPLPLPLVPLQQTSDAR